MFNNYVGKAGQFYAMSEFLMLGWNVAIPEVDRGDDIFVVKDDDGDLRRIQVKTAQARRKANTYQAQFIIPREQIIVEIFPVINFLLLVRLDDKWSDMIVITQPQLFELLSERIIGSSAKNVNIALRFEAGEVRLGKTNLSAFRSLISFPKINH